MLHNVYTRPDRARSMCVPSYQEKEVEQIELAKPVEVSKFTECHVTPQEVAHRMAQYLEIEQQDDILEPSAGTGNLIQGLLDGGAVLSQISAVEKHVELVNTLRERFRGPKTGRERVSLTNECFLLSALTSYKYDKIIINPPFKEAKKHIKAAEDLLRPGGVMVALVPVTFKHPTALELERLDSDTFKSAKVYTKIIRIEK